MLTLDGKTHLKRYLAGMVPAIAESMAFGIGDRPESEGDTALQFEVSRSNISLVSYDFETDRLIFKAPVPDGFDGQVFEVALFSTAVNSVSAGFGSRLLSTLDTQTEFWVDATDGSIEAYSTTGSRLGVNSLNHSPAAGGTKTSRLSEIFLNLSGYSQSDKFVFAYNVNNANTSALRFQFLTDASNYYEIALGTQTPGYKIIESPKSTATTTGTPDWSNITEIRVSTTSNANGASSVDFDAIRIEDIDTINPDYVMVSREVLVAPYTKENGKAQDIEFSLAVNL